MFGIVVFFPFPVPQVARSHESAGDASRKVRRRLESQCHVDEWVKDIVISLNAMFSGSEEQGSFDGGGALHFEPVPVLAKA